MNKFLEAQSMTEAKDLAPWACEILEVEGGYMAFEFYSEYETFLNQI